MMRVTKNRDQAKPYSAFCLDLSVDIYCSPHSVYKGNKAYEMMLKIIDFLCKSKTFTSFTKLDTAF